MSSTDTIVNLSGGIDSVYAAWRYMKDHPTKTLLLHHVNRTDNGHRNQRHQLEQQAVHNVLQWFTDNKLTNYEYTETNWSWQPPFHYNRDKFGNSENTIYDVELIGMITGVLLRHRQWTTVTNVVLSYSLEESPAILRRLQDYRLHLDNTHRTWRLANLMTTLSNRKLTWLFPMLHVAKEQMMHQMPAQLLNLCIYCENAKFETPVCGQCFTCRVVNRQSINKQIPFTITWRPYEICNLPY